MDAYVAALCYNTVEAEKLGLTPPTSWKDLTKPEYKGHIVMPNPNSSGTGFLDVSAWLQTFGEEGPGLSWDALHENIAAIPIRAPSLAAWRHQAKPSSAYLRIPGCQGKTSGAPIDIIFPSEGSGWEAEATAIIAGRPISRQRKRCRLVG